MATPRKKYAAALPKTSTPRDTFPGVRASAQRATTVMASKAATASAAAKGKSPGFQTPQATSGRGVKPAAQARADLKAAGAAKAAAKAARPHPVGKPKRVGPGRYEQRMSMGSMTPSPPENFGPRKKKSSKGTRIAS